MSVLATLLFSLSLLAGIDIKGVMPFECRKKTDNRT